jgi:hypothetical protein
MIENYRSGLLWRLMRRCPYVVTGLRRAGFQGGWLEGGNAALGVSDREQASASSPGRASAEVEKGDQRA